MAQRSLSLIGRKWMLVFCAGLFACVQASTALDLEYSGNTTANCVASRDDDPHPSPFYFTDHNECWGQVTYELSACQAMLDNLLSLREALHEDIWGYLFADDFRAVVGTQPQPIGNFTEGWFGYRFNRNTLILIGNDDEHLVMTVVGPAPQAMCMAPKRGLEVMRKIAEEKMRPLWRLTEKLLSRLANDLRRSWC